MKTISAIIAASVLFSTAAYADPDADSTVGRGNSRVALSHITPFVSNRTYRPQRNFQPGPFSDLGPADKVGWRR